jgi:hypothetical protein
LSLHSSEAPQGIDLSRPLLTYTNANQATTCTFNTRPRVSPHHVVNHSSQPGATIHWSSDVPVLKLTAMHAASLGKILNAGMTGSAAVTSPSSPTLPHARLCPRHSSTLYDAHKHRARLGHGKLGKHSGRLRQAQTTREKAKRPGVNSPTRPRGGSPDKASRLGFKRALTDSDVRQDVPTTKYCNSFLLPLVPPL